MVWGRHRGFSGDSVRASNQAYSCARGNSQGVGGCEFHVCGLLEHLRTVVLKGKGLIHDLYELHGVNGANQFGPSGLVACNLLRKQLEQWSTLVPRAGGVSVKSALLRSRLERLLSLMLCLRATGKQAYPRASVAIHMLVLVLSRCTGGLLYFYAWVNTPWLEFLGMCRYYGG